MCTYDVNHIVQLYNPTRFINRFSFGFNRIYYECGKLFESISNLLLQNALKQIVSLKFHDHKQHLYAIEKVNHKVNSWKTIVGMGKTGTLVIQFSVHDLNPPGLNFNHEDTRYINQTI